MSSEEKSPMTRATTESAAAAPGGKSRLDGRYLGRQCSGIVCSLIAFPLINDGGGNESKIVVMSHQ